MLMGLARLERRFYLRWDEAIRVRERS